MKTFLQYLNESYRLKESRQDLLKHTTQSHIDKILSNKTLVKVTKLHDKVFGKNNNQIILDVGVEDTPEDVINFLKSKGINIKLKEGNHLVDNLNIQYGKSVVPILKFLGRNKAPQSVITSMENYSRAVLNQSTSGSEFKILISRNPHEVAAAATNTSWESCMSPNWEVDKGRKKFEGPGWEDLPHEIKYGTLVAYVLRASASPNEDGEYNAQGKDGQHDKIGRVLIKMFESNDGDIAFFVEGKTYGTVSPKQLRIIKDWVKTNYHTKDGTYFKNTKIYNDDKKSSENVVVPKDTPNDTIVAKDKEHLISLINLYVGNDDLNFIDVSNITDMSSLFKHSLFKGDISKWDVSNVTDMSLMFNGSSFDGDISNWNVSNVTDMHEMFSLSNFRGDISNWNVSKVTDMSGMLFKSPFDGDISNWNVSNVSNMTGMFYKSMFDGNISKWNVGNVSLMEMMFSNSQFNGDISKWDVSSVTNMRIMFKNSQFNGDISKWNVSNVENMKFMFIGSPLKDNPPHWFK